MKVGVLKNLAKFTLVPESLFNKVAGEFCEIFKNTLYTEYQRTTAPGRS